MKTAKMAQSVARHTRNVQVGGSIPPLGYVLKKEIRESKVFCGGKTIASAYGFTVKWHDAILAKNSAFQPEARCVHFSFA